MWMATFVTAAGAGGVIRSKQQRICHKCSASPIWLAEQFKDQAANPSHSFFRFAVTTTSAKLTFI